jgi:hypothetical protein
MADPNIPLATRDLTIPLLNLECNFDIITPGENIANYQNQLQNTIDDLPTSQRHYYLFYRWLQKLTQAMEHRYSRHVVQTP